MRPRIGLTCDLGESAPGRPRAQLPLTYVRQVAAAGGLPVPMAPLPELIEEQLAGVDGLVLIGGDDVRMESFGEATHPAATPMHPLRQEYELALLRALDRRAALPVLGVCLGMQLMALHAGGRLQQHLGDVLPTAERHRHDNRHPILVLGHPAALRLAPGPVTSQHHQAVADAGRLRALATSDDGVIEAIDDPARRFYAGVQWHPERTEDGALGIGVFRQLVEAARAGARSAGG